MEMEFVVLTWRKGTIRIYVELSCWNDNSTTLCESSRINEETGNGKVRWHESYRSFQTGSLSPWIVVCSPYP